MGLEGSDETVTKMDTNCDGPLQLLMPMSMSDVNCNFLGELEATTGMECADQMQLLMQAQALLQKGDIYQKIDTNLQKTYVFQPNVFNNLPHATPNSHDDDQVTSLHRDTAINNLRFLNIFYGYNSHTFALAVNLLDRLLGKVKAHPKYLSCIATSCFYIAVRKLEGEGSNAVPTPSELVKLSQCGGTTSDLARMDRLILDKLQWQVDVVVTPLTFLELFYELFTNQHSQLANPTVFTKLATKLEVLMCQFDFTKYRAETLALSLLSHELQELGVLSKPEEFTPIVELQYYCQINDAEFIQCRGFVMDYLASWGNQRSKLPRLQLVWTVSKRTLNKLKPSTRCILDLEPIMEDEVDEFSDETDAGPFDSENDDISDLHKLSLGPSDCLSQAAQIRRAVGMAKRSCPLTDQCNNLSFKLPSNNNDDDDDDDNEHDQLIGNHDMNEFSHEFPAEDGDDEEEDEEDEMMESCAM